jgi:predicted metalloprotease with PDZ domain
MPAWAPGDYEILNYGQQVVEAQFLLGDKIVPSQKTDMNTWSIPAGANRAIYTVSESVGNFSPNLRVRPDETFVNGGGVFGWFTGEDNKEQTLLVASPDKQWVAIALPEKKGAAGWSGFTARDYTEMIDSPFVVGSNMLVAEFTVGGKRHRMVGYNDTAGVDMKTFADVAKPIVESNFAMFGSLPYDQYVFFCDFRGGGGGLEHLSSTRLGIYSKNGAQASGLIAHEYFHCFNVKSIREKPLGPFDYTKPAIVSTLWWLEGVTDYYASVMLLRAGLMNEQNFLGDMGGSYNGLLRNDARLKVTAAEASEKVWTNPNSQGWGGLSYYQKGKLVGACLDLAIRTESNGAKSLDDVIKALYQECKDRKPGYESIHLRELCVQFGGPKLGPIYDRCVTTVEELPLDDLLTAAGYSRNAGKVDRLANVATKANWPWPVK